MIIQAKLNTTLHAQKNRSKDILSNEHNKQKAPQQQFTNIIQREVYAPQLQSGKGSQMNFMF